MAISIKTILMALLLFQIVGCSSVKYLYARIFYNFEKLDSVYEIRYEKEVEALAQKSGNYFHNAIIKVEETFGNKFQTPPKMYVFADRERFTNFSNAYIGARAGGSHEGVYLSPRMLEEIETLPGVITHELVHTYLQQKLSPRRYRDELPAWFKEGIAVVISQGAGTEGVNLNGEIKKIINGDTFVANSGGDLYSKKHPKNMKPRVFYMQASLFTKYIWERNPKYFLQFVKKLEAKGFLISFSETYNADVYQIWKEFVNSLSEYNNHFHPASERRAGEVKRYEY